MRAIKNSKKTLGRVMKAIVDWNVCGPVVRRIQLSPRYENCNVHNYKHLRGFSWNSSSGEAEMGTCLPCRLSTGGVVALKIRAMH
jgi:hypothetical protein